ncbi:MAG: hypothetical protein JRD89_17995 [Deltaproteobacteria bacterium]|nr:hypothetical protein [Deltaproteobacteria bacterium]
MEKARKIFELSKEGKRIIVTLWEDNKLSSCITEAVGETSCETCQGDEQLCQEYIDYLKGKGKRGRAWRACAR